MANADEKNSTDTIIDSALYPYPDPLNTFILNAIFENATDIHLNVVEEEMVVIFRVDGIVHEKQRLSRAEGRTLLNQLKAAADLKVSKSFLPQEGQMRWRDEEEQVKNIRVTTVPMGDEECAHLRILSMPEKELEIDNLGFSDEHKRSIFETLDSLGCEQCNGYGYAGRIGMFETAGITLESAHKIASGIHSELLRNHFRESGIVPLPIDGIKKVADGITSTQELFLSCNFPGLLSERNSGISESAII